MPSPLFYIFAAIMLIGGTMVVFMRNPVSSALAMVSSFVALAAIFIGLNAFLVGILQILVYAGAIMVLFIFIIMLLDIEEEKKTVFRPVNIAAGVIIPLVLIIQLVGVINKQPGTGAAPELNYKEALAVHANEDTMIHKRLSDKRLPDTHLIGQKLYTEYNFPIQMVAVLLLVATVGCVTLSKKSPTSPAKIKDQLPSTANTPTPAAEPVTKTAPEPKTEPEPTASAEATEPAEDKEPEQQPETTETTAHDDKRGLIYTSAPSEVDDLKVISGVGPVLEQKLNDFGIYTYKQIAAWTEENISEFDDLLSFKGRITRDDWLKQAAELDAKKNA